MQIKTAAFLADTLQFCIDRKAHTAAKIIQAQIFRANLFSNTFLVNRLIELHSKCSDITSARHLFDLMPERNAISWNLMISMFSRSDTKEAALDGYYSMRLDGFMPTHFTLASVFSACGGLVEILCGRECHGISIKLGLEDNKYVGNALLGMYMKCKAIADAYAVFKSLPEHNEVSFTTMMDGLVKLGSIDKALDMFRQVHRAGIVDSVSLSSMLTACSISIAEELLVSDGMKGKQIHGLLVKFGFERDIHDMAGNVIRMGH